MKKFLCVFLMLTIFLPIKAYGENMSLQEQLDLFSLVMAAQGGDVEAINEVAIRQYRNKAYEKAFKNFSIAAEKGFALAQYNLGSMYRNGYGTERNYEKAYYWFSQASANGYLGGDYVLGCMYYAGEYVEQNKELAQKHWRYADIKIHKKL